VLPRVHSECVDVPPKIATIGVGYNGSHASVAALALGRRLADALGARVRVLEVVCPPRALHLACSGADLGRRVDVLLCRARERLADLDGVDGCAVYGIAEEELMAFTEEVDLLVIGLGGEGGGGCARQLAAAGEGTGAYLRRNARCPLLVLPRSARLFMRPPPARAAWINSRARSRRDECCIG
jgi:nucleotide-binding universal stress UspA family protein